MRKAGIIMMVLMLAGITDLQAQRRKNAKARTASHVTKRDYRDARVLPAMPPGPQAPKMAVPQEKGRTVMQEQMSNSGAVMQTPVPPPHKVVITPAPPPPGNTGTYIPPKR